MKRRLAFVALVLLFAALVHPVGAQDKTVIKFAHHDLGENVNDTFRIENGLLEVRYDKWTSFNQEFGHIFYKQPFSYYQLVAE